MKIENEADLATMDFAVQFIQDTTKVLKRKRDEMEVRLKEALAYDDDARPDMINYSNNTA